MKRVNPPANRAATLKTNALSAQLMPPDKPARNTVTTRIRPRPRVVFESRAKSAGDTIGRMNAAIVEKMKTPPRMNGPARQTVEIRVIKQPNLKADQREMRLIIRRMVYKLSGTPL